MISDERLREAAQKVEESMLASLPDPEDCKIPPPPEIERKMEKRSRRASHPIRHRVMKAVACFLLVVLVGGGSVLALSAEARATVVGWVRDIYQSYETWFVYHFVGANDTVSEDITYRPTWIPDDYTEKEVLDLSGQTDIHYTNSDGLMITFGYSTNYDVINYYVEHDGAELYRVFIGSIPADLYLDTSEEEPNVLTWNDSSSKTIFWIIAQEDGDVLVEIAESVVQEK